MANEPISLLTQTSAVSATDCVPIVSGGLTQKVAINTLVRSASANIMPDPFFYASGQYLASKGVPSYIITTQNKLNVYLLILGSTINVNAMSIYVNVAAAGSTVSLGVYNATALGNMPNALIAGTTATVASSATGFQTATFSTLFTLTPGVYWLATAAQGGTPTLQQIYNTNMWTLPWSSPVVGTTILGYNMTASGTLPSTFTMSAPSVNVPRIWLKMV